ncbi:MAG TPA: hypothetical protein VHH88_07510 [Verrucomicrobiae bacterium]|nr:hypothetical protein [Verrucomicrobiae bacterium]
MLGLLALFAASGWIVARPEILTLYHYNPLTIAATHLFVLGWLCSVVMGAMYQLVPVALETRLHSVRLAKVHFALHAIAVPGMVLAFRAWRPGWVAVFGAVFAAGAGLFIYNIARALAKIPKWNAVAAAVVSALAWISLAMSAGLLLAVARSGQGNFMNHFQPLSAVHAHAHLGVLGFFITLMAGVSYRLIPMFTLSEIQSPRRALASGILLNAGLAGAFVTVLFLWKLKVLFAGVIGAGFAVYGWEIATILSARKRRMLDWGIKYFLTAVGLLLPLVLLALVLSWPDLPLNSLTARFENLYGFTAIAGVVSLAVIGMLYKILPFLIWFGTYSKHIGRAQVPALADMVSERAQCLGYWVFLAALGGTACAILLGDVRVVRAGAYLFAAGLLTLAWNVAKVLSHHFRPHLAPLAPPPQPKRPPVDAASSGDAAARKETRF